MAQTVRTGDGASKWLKSEGFSPIQSCKRRVAGVTREWCHVDGRKAEVGYGLYSMTGQTSRGAGAVWGYIVKIEDA